MKKAIQHHSPASALLIVMVAVAVASCGGGGGGDAPTPTPTPTPTPAPAPEVEPSGVPACIPSQANPASRSPYTLAVFKTALDNAEKLQYPVSSNACLSNTDLRDLKIDSGNFEATTDGLMRFAYASGVRDNDSGVTTRMELRGYSFNATAVGKRWEGQVLIFNPANRAANFTIGQVFGETDGAPILRIEFAASRNGLTDHLWAFYRKGLGDGQTVTQDLGPAPTSTSPITLRMEYGIDAAVKVTVNNGTPFVFSENFNLWASPGKTTYFKAGCYLQASGACDVRFKSLSFDR